MVLRLLACLALLLVLAHPAAACRYQPVSFDDALEKAPNAFIGTVKSVKDGHVEWAVETGVKGLQDGAPFTTEIGGESCDIRFEAGQRWMFLGTTHPTGSLLLEDARGNRMEENIKTVNDKFSGAGEKVRKTLALTGTLERDCAPWDGTAYAIKLSNGVSARIYSSLEEYEHRDRKDAATFSADNKSERGHGQIIICPVAGNTPENLPCRSVEGTITLGPVDSQSAKGSVEFIENGTRTFHQFEVKRVEKQVFCG